MTLVCDGVLLILLNLIVYGLYLMLRNVLSSSYLQIVHYGVTGGILIMHYNLYYHKEKCQLMTSDG